MVHHSTLYNYHHFYVHLFYTAIVNKIYQINKEL